MKNDSPKVSIYISDLTHSYAGINSLSFPLGAGFIAAYLEKVFSDMFSIDVFKMPKDLAVSVLEKAPDILALSCYCWNMELGKAVCEWVKGINPDVIIICGGPNFPVKNNEKLTFLQDHIYIDYYVENEGEFGFADLIDHLRKYNYSRNRLNKTKAVIKNTLYLYEGELICGDIVREKNISLIPSPYISGHLDKYFNYPLIPAIETNRGCPFSCTYCADGVKDKNKVSRFEVNRTKDDLNYIAQSVSKTNELIITDLNFGMYKQDVEIAKDISEVRSKYNYPNVINASAGKNNPDRIIEIIKILDNTWMVGSAIQSISPTVLTSVSRSNINSDAFANLITYGNEVKSDSFTYTEIILGLPGDSKQRHYNSLKFGIEKKAKHIKMYQAMLLIGTEMATSEARKKYDLITKHRIIPGANGIYCFEDGGKSYQAIETEEIIVGNSSLSFDEYVSCRKMNLVVDYFYNGSLFEEFYASFKVLDIPVFDFLVYIHESIKCSHSDIQDVFINFEDATVNDVYDTKQEIFDKVESAGGLKEFIKAGMARNELLEGRLSLTLIMDKTMDFFVEHVLSYIANKSEKLFNKNVILYYEELGRFILARKFNTFVGDNDPITDYFYYDFDMIVNNKYEVDPRRLRHDAVKRKYVFKHNKLQVKKINIQKEMYIRGSGGLAKMIQKSNMKKLSRGHTRVDASVAI